MIREITEREVVHTFFAIMAELELGGHFTADDATHVAWLRKRISSHFARGGRFFGRYLEDDSPVGLIAVLHEGTLKGVPCIGRWARILALGLFPQCQGQGFGTELLQHVESLARREGAYCLYADTYAGNHEAIAFYGDSEFVPVATLPDVHGEGDEGQVHMRKVLR